MEKEYIKEPPIYTWKEREIEQTERIMQMFMQTYFKDNLEFRST